MMQMLDTLAALERHDAFIGRHIGPDADEQAAMLAALGLRSLEELTDKAVPAAIRADAPLDLPPARSEAEVLAELAELAGQNRADVKSLLGLGYYGTHTPPVILRNVLENPGWYTSYTPYQAEISQGRLEALLNFQTVVTELTGLEIANASLLDEATAAAEAMALSLHAHKGKSRLFLVADDCHPQTIAVVSTRARPLGIEVRVVKSDAMAAACAERPFGVLVQYPASDGAVRDPAPVIAAAKVAGALTVVASDLLALCLLKPPGAMGADVVVGSSQRFGVPLGFGGPHAAFFATTDDFKRQMPGRLVGVSVDANGAPALRLALQTREQHIRREKATSNICTAQVLLAVMAGFYAVWHGPEGLRTIARRCNLLARLLGDAARKLGLAPRHEIFFDTVALECGPKTDAVLSSALSHGFNLRRLDATGVAVAMNETVTRTDLERLIAALAEASGKASPALATLAAPESIPAGLARTGEFLTQEVFHRYHPEHEMLRYLRRLQEKDIALDRSMIPLGSCTMKLNATAEMIPISYPGFARIHPFAPTEQTRGYQTLIRRLESWLCTITGFHAVSLQPNAGSAGEYAGLLAIRAWHASRNELHRDVCLIPTSAHGTNPASAAMAGLRVIPVACDRNGNIDVADLRAKAAQHAANLAALMVTYPSTHGVFETAIRDICAIVHQHGGQVYMDGANLNAQVGLTSPGRIGADVCHLNLHKTFCLSAGTPVVLADGVSRPIEQLLRGQRVSAWSPEEKGVRGACLEAVIPTGRKECVEITLEDGRKLTCTPDHRILTTSGWVEAGQLLPTQDRVVLGPETPLDDPTSDAAAEARFRVVWGPYEFTMATPEARARTLAFFRLLGAACSDGTYSKDSAKDRIRVRLYFGTRYDADRAREDIELVTGCKPQIGDATPIFGVWFPAELVRALAAVPGIGDPGKRVYFNATLPHFVSDPLTPKALLREFLGALFGGDGSAPTIVHLSANPHTMKEIKFHRSHVDRETLERFMEEVRSGLARLGVEAQVGLAYQPKQQRGVAAQWEPRWKCEVTVVWGSAFAERVGFRYCAHKSARLSAATAWWRIKETIQAQKAAVARRALATVANTEGSHFGPKAIWEPAVSTAYHEFASEQPVLNPYYTAFRGFARVTKQHLTNAVNGQMGMRWDLRGLRRSHRRAVVAAKGRGGENTGMPTLHEFLTRIGARHWFNQHTPGGAGYKVTYATAQEATVEPTMHLAVIHVRNVGERDVYDLTVADLHSFIANGVVVHNCIPHGGGGPGVGPIGVAAHLAPFLPNHPLQPAAGPATGVGPVSAAPWGSAGILPISYAYIALMGGQGLTRASQVAILNANYVARRLELHYPVLYKGANGLVAHECIVDCRGFQASTGVTVEDIAKRLQDFGYHAPTMSFPVAGTLMIEPTESESKTELDRFCEAMIAIREEIRAVEQGKLPRDDNPLKNAPHTAAEVTAQEWTRPYSRQQAALPLPWVAAAKYWPPVKRVDNVHGDRNLVCTCGTVESYAEPR